MSIARNKNVCYFADGPTKTSFSLVCEKEPRYVCHFADEPTKCGRARHRGGVPGEAAIVCMKGVRALKEYIHYYNLQNSLGLRCASEPALQQHGR